MLKFSNSDKAGNHLNSMIKTLMLSVSLEGDKQADIGCYSKISARSGEDPDLTSIFTVLCQQIDDD